MKQSSSASSLLSGKNYTVLDGDIIFFKFNAGAGLTSKKK